jgi:hypothetical protein
VKLAYCISGLATVGLFVGLMSCTVITDVDRSKIDSEGAAGAPASATGTGRLDAYQDGVLIGWAFIPDDNEPVEVRVEVDGEQPVFVTADEHRPALQSNGTHPTGDAGFRLDLGPLASGTEIHAYIDSTDFELRNSPLTVE